MSRVVDAVAPTRLGRPFRWLLGGYWTLQIGDGIALAAGPLLVASLTHSPLLVALAAVLQRLPWLAFGLHAGAIADRLDRKRVTLAMMVARLVVLAVLCVFIATGDVSIWIVLGAMLVIGVAEVFGDSASSTLLPMLVDKRDLGIANARTMAGFLVFGQLVGAPVGAFLFALGAALPFATQAICVCFAFLLVGRVIVPPMPPSARAGTGEEEPHVRRDILEGVRWLWGHAAIRSLALTIFSFNITWGAAWAVLVLYATRLLGMSEVEYGLLTTMSAIGGLAGTFSYGWLERRVALSLLMRVCLTLEVLMHLVLAVNRSTLVAYAVMLVFGCYAFLWGTISNAVRQRAVPHEFQGRVGSVYRVGLFGGLVVGQFVGGVLADVWGLTAPFWFAFVGSGLTLVWIWRSLAWIAHAEEPAPSPTR